jgi:hypothetical protein
MRRTTQSIESAGVRVARRVTSTGAQCVGIELVALPSEVEPAIARDGRRSTSGFEVRSRTDRGRVTSTSSLVRGRRGHQPHNSAPRHFFVAVSAEKGACQPCPSSKLILIVEISETEPVRVQNIDTAEDL